MSDLPNPAWHRQQMEDLEHRTGVQVRAHEIEFPGGHRFHVVDPVITDWGDEPTDFPNGWIGSSSVHASIPNENGPTLHRVAAFANRATRPPTTGEEEGKLREGKVEASFPTYAHLSPAMQGVTRAKYNFGWAGDIMHHEQFGEALRGTLSDMEQAVKDMPEKRRASYGENAQADLREATRNRGFIKFANFETGASSLFDPRTGEVKHHQD